MSSSRFWRRRTALLLTAVAVIILLLLGVTLEESLNGGGAGGFLQGGGESTSLGSMFVAGNASSTSGAPLENLTQLVNPFLGTGNSPSPPCEAACGGDVFPGAAYPMGMVQWSPDTPSNPAGGYFYGDSTIKDFSLTHYSGRGCQVYQDFPFMPYVGNLSVSPASDASPYYSTFSHARETARPGYYEVHLDGPNVTAELSATPHTGVGRFVYPPSSSASTIIINAGGSVNGNSNSGVSIIPAEDEITGFAQSVVGCGSNPYVVYFAAKFDRPFARFGTWNGPMITPGSSSSKGQHTGAFVLFETTSNPVVRVQVGISFVSVPNAQKNLAAEYANFDLGLVAKTAAAAWNSRLNSIIVGGGTHDEQITFYTSLYHVFFHPNIFSDANGEYLGFDGQVHVAPPGHYQYENIGTWDIYRTQIQLLSILDPSAASDIAQSLLNDAQQSNGPIPRWEQANADSRGMSGDGGSTIIAEAYSYGVTGFDARAALQAMISGQPYQREGFSDYAKLGYVPADRYQGLGTASSTLEYANDDFAIAQFARAIGNSTVYGAYLQRSGSWKNLFNAGTGYIQPRNADGSWVQGFDPTSDKNFLEGDSAQYTWMVTFDLGGLFQQMGGESTALVRLNAAVSRLNVGPFSPFVWMGNEVSVEIPWEFDFLQAPSRTQAVVRQIETQLWMNSPGGMPGNDDGGEMSSWYIFATMGLYPEITGIAGFVIGSPLFTSVAVKLPGGHELQIDAPQASDANPYVQGLTLGGSATSSLWLPWSSIRDGATLSFTLGGEPSGWGSAPQDAPPSYPPSP